MKNYLLPLLITALFPSAVLGADIPAIKSIPTNEKKSIWEGLYLGLSGGIGGVEASSSQIDSSYSPENKIFSTPAYSSLGSSKIFGNGGSGPIFGGQIGYNFIYEKHLMFGLETDLNYSNIAFINKGRGDYVTHSSFPSFGGVNSSQSSISLDWFGTARGRIGYSIGRLLPYINGGFAYGNLSTNASDNSLVSFPPSLSLTTSNVNLSKLLTGWTIGAGAEYYLFDNISLKAEFNFLQFQGYSFTNSTYNYYGGSGIDGIGLHNSTGNLSKLGYYQTKVGLNYFPEIINRQTSTSINNSSDDSENQNYWNGEYIGINGSYASGNTNDNQAANGIISIANANANSHTNSYGTNGGALAGVQAGYNYLLPSNFIIGTEADFEWSGLQDASNANGREYAVSSLALTSQNNTNFRNRLEWYGTARARLGFNYGRLMPYITGGFAYGLSTLSEINYFGPTPTFYFSNPQHSFLRAGYNIGAGLEFIMFNNLSTKFEYLYTDLGQTHQKYNEYLYTYSFPGINFRERWRDLDFHQVRVGLNYHFNAGEEKVVAKY